MLALRWYSYYAFHYAGIFDANPYSTLSFQCSLVIQLISNIHNIQYITTATYPPPPPKQKTVWNLAITRHYILPLVLRRGGGSSR